MINRLLLLGLVLLPAALVQAGPGETIATTASLGGSDVTGNKVVTLKNSEGDNLVKKHCTGCHSEDRIMTRLQSLHGEQDDYYEKEVKTIILRKIRMTNGDISRQEGRKIMDYLVTVWQRQKTEARPTPPVS